MSCARPWSHPTGNVYRRTKLLASREGIVPKPILRLATRFNRRTRWTAWAIAIACMVLVGSLSLVDGLSAGVDSVTGRFQAGPTVYVRGSDLMTSVIDPNVLASLPKDFQALRIHAGTLAMDNVSIPVVVAALEDHRDGNASVPFPGGPANAVAIDVGLEAQIEAASGKPLGGNVTLTLFGSTFPGLPVAAPPASRPNLFPDTWAWVRPELFGAMNPLEGGPIQAILTPAPLDAATASGLGLTPLSTVGAVGFARGSVAEARAALDALALLIAVVIGLLVYSAMGLEVHQRREEIRTLRALGASPSTVASVYEGQALLLAALGATLGSALGIVAAHAIVSFAPLAGVPNLILLSPPLGGIVLAYLVAVGAAGLAGLAPSARALRLVRGIREVGPS